MVDCNSLENCQLERVREFESHRFRQKTARFAGHFFAGSERAKLAREIRKDWPAGQSGVEEPVLGRGDRISNASQRERFPQ